MKKYILFYLLFCLSVGGWAKDFVHPGILHSSEALRRIAGLVKNDVNPSMGSFNKLKAEPEASYHYCIQGPFRFISRSGEYGYTKSPCEDDFNAAYYNAIMWNITKDRRHADKAMEIIRNYAATLEKIFPMDAPLCAGLQGFILVNAAEIMRYTYVEEHNENGWTYKDTEQTEDMFRNVFLPILSEFYKTKPYTNGNWGIAVTKAQIGISVFLNDTKLYDDALDFFYHGKDNGTLPNYVAETGQIQESGRDQAHCMLGIGCLAEIAEVAWNQGDDLYGALDNRIMKGCEYLSKSNLGYDVPFHVWKDLTGKYSNWQSLGQASMGEFRAVFELPYNHYVERKKMEMPYTKMVLNRIRPEGAGFTCDNPGFGTLLFYLGKDEERERKGRINENLKENLFGWHFAAASLKLKGDKMMLMSSGISCKKKGIMYDAGSYPYIAIKISHLPKNHNKNWFALSYNVMSAPEFWVFGESDAQIMDGNIYVFSINKLKAEPEASYHYCIQGPFRFISRSGEYGYTKSPCEDDFNAAYYNAIMWNITKDRRHADKAMEIIRNYAATLEKIFPMDAPLCAGLQGFILVNAAEIMRYTYVEEHNENGWTYKDTEQTEDMFRNVFLPILSEFYKTKPYTNGNWGIAVTKAQIGISVFLNDTKLYDDALDFFYHGKDNGTLPNYVAETGQIQESGRDQAHCMLGIGCLAEIAEVAWNQGDDLYGALDNRIMKGCEYLSKSNLGYDVPFHVWKDLTGKYSNWQSLGQASMGEFRAVFELPYNHYVERKKMEMPYTKMVLNRIRPEGAGFTCDNPGFGTLLFYLGKDEERERKGRINENLKENLFGWHFAAASLKLKGDKMMLMSSGISCKKKGIMYDAGSYPYIAIKISHLPKNHNKNWFALSYNVMSAPEFWVFGESDAQIMDGNIYVFSIHGAKSNNGTEFSKRLTNVTLLMDFGETGGEGVDVEWIRSVADLEF